MVPFVDDYETTPIGYLRRCREQLMIGSKASMFYAAFELRSCVEARLAEYLEHYEPHRGKKVQAFRIGENAKVIRKIWSGETIARLTFLAPWGPVTQQFHTPVPRRLKEYCEQKVDQLRHSQSRYRKPDDPWWAKTRNDLTLGYRSAWLACQGDMVVPPLWNSTTRATHPMVFNITEANRTALDAMQKLVGQELQIEVTYLDQPPAEWVCDL